MTISSFCELPTEIHSEIISFLDYTFLKQLLKECPIFVKLINGQLLKIRFIEYLESMKGKYLTKIRKKAIPFPKFNLENLGKLKPLLAQFESLSEKKQFKIITRFHHHRISIFMSAWWFQLRTELYLGEYQLPIYLDYFKNHMEWMYEYRVHYPVKTLVCALIAVPRYFYVMYWRHLQSDTLSSDVTKYIVKLIDSLPAFFHLYLIENDQSYGFQYNLTIGRGDFKLLFKHWEHILSIERFELLYYFMALFERKHPLKQFVHYLSTFPIDTIQDEERFHNIYQFIYHLSKFDKYFLQSHLLLPEPQFPNHMNTLITKMSQWKYCKERPDRFQQLQNILFQHCCENHNHSSPISNSTFLSLEENC